MITVVAGGAAGALVSRWTADTGGTPVAVDLDAIPTLTVMTVPGGVPVLGPTTAGVGHLATGVYAAEYSAPSSLAGGTYLAVWDGLYGGDPVQADETVIVQPAVTASTAYAIGVTSPQNVKPYLSRDMFKYHQRQGVSLNLVPNGTSMDNDAALAALIQQGSDWVFGICGQTLTATLDTVRDTVNVSRNGWASVWPRYRPVIAVTAVSMGSDVSDLVAISDLTNIDVQESMFRVPALTGNLPQWTSQGPLQFGGVSAPMDQAQIQYSYVNGWPHAFMTAPAAAGATALALDDTTGIIEGATWLTAYAGRNRLRFLAGAVSNAVNGLGFGPGEVGCPPLPYAIASNDAYPTCVTALPGNAIEATSLAIRSFIKSRSVGNVAAGTTTKGGAQSAKDPLGAGADLLAAEKMLADGNFIVPVS